MINSSSIAVVGAGTMGIGISKLFLANSFTVTLIDKNTENLHKARVQLESSLTKEQMNQLNLKNQVQVNPETFMVIEAIPEIKHLKDDLFVELEEQVSSKTIIASNTSGIPINDLGSNFKHKNRFLGMHFYMPAETVPIVELIQSDYTSPKIIESLKEALTKIGKIPIHVKKDIPGFIGNRLQHAMAREAISLLEKEVATAEEIDLVARFALGIRLVFAGPLEQRDLNGLDTHYNIATYLYKDLENSDTPSLLLKDKVDQGCLGVKTGCGFYSWHNNASDIQSELNNKLTNILNDIKNIDRLEPKGNNK